ncbi:unnamed protein product, partial [Ixodes persulcatus]
NVQVDPGLCQLRQRSVVIFLLHPLQLLPKIRHGKHSPGQIQSIQFQEALQSECSTAHKIRLVENSQGSLIGGCDGQAYLLVIVYGGCDERKDHVVDVHALCHALVQFPCHLVPGRREVVSQQPDAAQFLGCHGPYFIQDHPILALSDVRTVQENVLLQLRLRARYLSFLGFGDAILVVSDIKSVFDVKKWVRLVLR